jgi:hypothetical protein
LNRHNVKKMTLKEFRESGYLQELNRLFLHPLGLAMEVTINDDGTEFFSGVWDCRDDPEGIVYSPDLIDDVKARRIYEETRAKQEERLKRFGYIIQPTRRR